MNIVLFSPQIPQNTGNIVRTCAVTGARLFLVRPLGFSVSNRMLKRAGLDYWEGVDVEIVDNFQDFIQNADARFFFFSAHAQKRYTDIEFQKGDFLVFGSETAGLPEWIWEKWPEQFCTIPMKDGARCLNLANAVSIVLYESMRQFDFVL